MILFVHFNWQLSVFIVDSPPPAQIQQGNWPFHGARVTKYSYHSIILKVLALQESEARSNRNVLWESLYFLLWSMNNPFQLQPKLNQQPELYWLIGEIKWELSLVEYVESMGKFLRLQSIIGEMKFKWLKIWGMNLELLETFIWLLSDIASFFVCIWEFLQHQTHPSIRSGKVVQLIVEIPSFTSSGLVAYLPKVLCLYCMHATMSERPDATPSFVTYPYSWIQSEDVVLSTQTIRCWWFHHFDARLDNYRKLKDNIAIGQQPISPRGWVSKYWSTSPKHCNLTEPEALVLQALLLISTAIEAFYTLSRMQPLVVVD